MADTIDLNSDLGESFGAWTLGDDAAMFPLVTSANIACGFHAGDPRTMRISCALAAQHGVAIGAHVSYRDLAGFGRRTMDVAPDELTGDVLYQLAALDGIARSAGTRVAYVKPHGALYNRIAVDVEQAGAVTAAIASYDRSLPVLGLAGTAIDDAARAEGIGFRAEAFVDRAYSADGMLLSRRIAGAVLEDVPAIARRAVRLARGRSILAADGREITVPAESLCVHGDTPGAVAMARAVRAALEEDGIRVEPFR